MKSLNLSAALLIVSGLLGVALLQGCGSREKVTTYEVTRSGDNWAESETVQKRQGPGNRRVVEKQSVYEEIRCEKNGVQVRVSSPEACIKAGGKVIENLIIDEQSMKR